MTSAPPEPPARSIDRIPALDGVRGLAVLWVMVFHFTFAHSDKRILIDIPYRLFRYGDRGVDLFFVLSGFLITSVLLKLKAVEPRLGAYMGTFYWRRSLRIFPLYYVALLIFLVVVPWFVQRTPQTSELLANQWMLWLYVSNIGMTFIRADVFDAGPIRLMHFWSLAIEEQFYLCWPIVIWTFARRGVLIACAIGAAISLAAWYGMTRPGVAAATWPFTLCRFQALLAGAAMATLLPAVLQSRRLQKIVGIIAVVGLSALAAQVFGDLRHRFGGSSFGAIALAWAFDLLTLLGIAAGVGWLALNRRGRFDRLMASRLLVFFGKYSYGLYVWHYSVVMLLTFRFLTLGQLSKFVPTFLAIAINIVVGIGASLLLALLSWRLIEQPMLRLKDRRPPLAPRQAEPFTAP